MKHSDKGSGRKEVLSVVRRAGSQRSIFRVQQILRVGTLSSGDSLQLENRDIHLKPVVQKWPHLFKPCCWNIVFSMGAVRG